MLLINERRSVRVEVTFDNGKYLNWRSPSNVQAIVLRSWSSGLDTLTTHRSASSEVAHGVVDISCLSEERYSLYAICGGETLPVTYFSYGKTEATRNVGVTQKAQWSVQQVEDETLQLQKLTRFGSEAALIRIDSGLGVVTLTILSTEESQFRLQLINRKTKHTIVSRNPEVNGSCQHFRLSNLEWEAAKLEPNGKKTVWDVYLINLHLKDEAKRLSWEGSAAARPRETIRFRPTYSWETAGKLFRIRPYWTLDQYLSLEITLHLNPEGIKK